jgi:parallel beta-helix repeat protein
MPERWGIDMEIDAMNQNKWTKVISVLAWVFFVFAAGCSIGPPDVDKDNGGTTPPITEDPEQPQEVDLPPVAVAGPDQAVIITEAENVPLDGSGSYDPEQQPLTYHWYCSDQGVSFSEGNNIAQPTVTLPSSGAYVFVLVVGDGVNLSGPSFLTITVESPDAWVDSELNQDYPSQSRYRTIQAAVKALAEESGGGLIAVDHGPYNEQLNINRGVWLYGLLQSDGQRPLIHYAAGENEAVVVLQEYAGLHGLRITCDANAEVTNTSEVTAISIQGVEAEITRCRIENSKSDGIVLSAGTSATISQIQLETIAGEGVVANAGSSVWLQNSRIVKTDGSGIWLMGATHVELENNVIYDSGWHGIDAQNCAAVMVDNCSIIEFGNDGVERQAGLNITDGQTVVMVNNLIVMGDYETLVGVKISKVAGAEPLEFFYNYLYSTQLDPNYYEGLLVDETNMPNQEVTHSEDPLLIDPEGGNFGLESGSPAIGDAENVDGFGAQGAVLQPFIGF